MIVGASRGLGLAMAAELLRRGWRVIATARSGNRAALDALVTGSDGRLSVLQLDVTVSAEIRAAAQSLHGTRLDLLLVNAGVINSAPEAPMLEVPDPEYTGMMLANALGPIRVIECMHACVPADGVIAVMSSRLGSLTANATGFWPAYASSKAALNMLLRNFADRCGGARAVVAVTPGWVRTEMGGTSADLSIEESVPRVVDVLIAAAGKRGSHFLNYDGEAIPW